MDPSHIPSDFINGSSGKVYEKVEVLKEKICVWTKAKKESEFCQKLTLERRYWSILERDVVDAVSYFFKDGSFPKGGNSSFIALIPKMQDAKLVKDYRPISLIGRMYKTIAKILANQLVGVLGDIVNEVQYAFVTNRQILDGPFILNELLQWCKSKKKQTMIFKINFEKAYDSVRWDYLNDVLNKFGFGTKWRGWIQTCLSSSRGSILVNGSPTASDLRLNIHKSKIMGVAVEEEKVNAAALKMGCSTLQLPFSYLGIKVGDMMSHLKSWDEIIDSLYSRLSRWKMKTLSIRSRLTLLKSVLGSTPIYYMSIFKVPSQVLKRMEAIRSHFFNGANVNEKKMSRVKWNRVLASKDKGGLGVLSFFALNRALLFKWEEAWRGDSMFKVRFLRVYALELNKRITVADKLNHVDLGLSLRRHPRDGVELEQFNELKANIEGVELPLMKDR
ncbi:RNA-directed DNA polymerase, eukaryota, reverse transcriptase zinc-binding domain protein [Tanacetum coccineum]|uniref:RNA-directed DNA polymerase, eukaryota, reverse transcriptase zinc-binding domain protein n=1 Tax=Tanacetum coccineum TaxID=301880 RepID=A0ABQ4YKM7_9ASTR